MHCTLKNFLLHIIIYQNFWVSSDWMHCHKCVVNLTIGCNTSSGVLSISSNIYILRSIISGHVFYTLPKWWWWPTLICVSWNHTLQEYVANGSRTLCKQCGLSWSCWNHKASCWSRPFILRIRKCSNTLHALHWLWWSAHCHLHRRPHNPHIWGCTPYSDLWTVQRPLMKFSGIFHGPVMEVYSVHQLGASVIHHLSINCSLSQACLL
jgi:hypothetical protein